MTKVQLKKELKKANKVLTLKTLKLCDELGIKYELIYRIKNKFYFKYSYRDQHFYITGHFIVQAVDKINSMLVNDKEFVRRALTKKKIKTPRGFIVKDFSEIKPQLKKNKIDFPLVLKPNYTGEGVGVIANISDWEILTQAWKNIKSIKNKRKKDEVIVEEYFLGNDYRLFILNGKMIAAVQRVHPYITGDGKKTVAQLIDQQLVRGRYKKVDVDWEVKKNLKRQKLTLKSILGLNQVIRVRENANMSTGGLVVECADQVCSKFKKIAEQCAQEFGLVQGGIDLLTKDISNSRSDYRIIEVNYGPEIFELHDSLDLSKPSPIMKKVLKAAFNIK